jgi:ATP-binding cassette subfamily B protein
MNNDVRILNQGLLDALPNVAALMTRLVAAMAVLASMEPWFTLVICGAGGFVILATGLLRRRLKILHKAVSEREGRVLSFLQETLEKLMMVQAMDAGAEMERRSEGLLADRYSAQRRRKNMSLMTNTCVNLLSQGASFAALLWCGTKLLRGQLSFGSLTAVTQLVSQIQAPVMNLSAVIPQYIAMSAAAERLKELSELEPEPPALGSDGGDLYRRMTSIRAEGLCFSYDRDVLLEQVSLELPKGSFAVVTGSSGIGKSTLLKLLMGFCRPGSGRLYLQLEGEQVDAGRAVRHLFAYVPQGNLLLSGTLRENLTLAKPDATQAQLEQALYVSAMDEYLPQLPDGLETLLGENGAGLSEGQAQRLAIARAVLGGAPILLLDECTSALDADTEQKVLERLRALPDRTCIAVTHRPAAIRLCDVQLEVSEGHILVKKR